MDNWKYYGITHGDHLVCNPLSEAKVEELAGLLDLPAGARVIDIACGKAELLCRLANRHRGKCTGVDISPYEVRAAKQKVAERRLDEFVEIVEGDGADLEVEQGSADAAMCIGADWVFGGYAATLKMLAGWTKTGGIVMIGAPYKMREPEPEWVEREPEFAPTLVTDAANAQAGLDMGLDLTYRIASNQDDWDRYEGLQWRAARRYAAEHPDDPDLPELLERTAHHREMFLRWERDMLGWAIYVFRKS